MQHRGRALVAVTAGYFLIMFAVSPVSVALPSISASLGIDVSTASWIMTAYLLPLTACLLPAGRLGDMVGHRRVFTAGLAVATAGAVAAALAPSLPLLLGARALQGLGAALASATCLPIITQVSDASRRGRAVGLATMASSLGAMVGTGVAPLFVEYLSWHWVFYAGAAGGLVALALALRVPAEPRAPATRTRLDWPGATVLLLCLTVASLSLSHFHDGPESFADGWRWHVPMHAAALALLGMFVFVERRARAPLIRLDQLRNGLFTTAVGANGVLHMTMMMTTFSLPFLVQRGLGLGPLQVGTMLVVMQACTTGMTMAAGWLYDRTRSPWLCVVALVMVASGMTTLGLFATHLSYGGVFAVVLWMGIGSGVFMTSNNTRIMGALATDLRGFASGMLETTRQYGHTLGVAVGTVGLAGALAAAAVGEPSAADALAVRAGFGQSALIMAAIAWIGVALASFPILARLRGGVSAVVATPLPGGPVPAPVPAVVAVQA